MYVCDNNLNYNEPFEINQDRPQEDQNFIYESPLTKDVIKLETPPYVMTVDLEEGKSDKLEIFFDSIPEKLAFDFSKKHNLDFEAMQFLIDEITKLVLSKDINSQKNNNIQECIQEVDEELNSELNISGEIIPKVKKDEISIKKEDPTIIDSPQEKSSIIALTNNDNNKTNNLKNVSSNNSSIPNNSLSSISRLNNLSKIDPTKPLDIKQFSYQLFLDKTNNSDLIKKNKDSKNDKASPISRKINIFERLYQESKSRKTKKIQMTNTSEQIGKNHRKALETQIKKVQNKQIINYGERLYNKGMKMKENQSKKIEKIKVEKDVCNKAVYTFKPKLVENIYEDNVELIKVNQKLA